MADYENYNEAKLILFFDEINTNQNVDGILKEILIDRKLNGNKLPHLILPIAAANPYKFKTNQNEEDDSLRIVGCN